MLVAPDIGQQYKSGFSQVVMMIDIISVNYSINHIAC